MHSFGHISPAQDVIEEELFQMFGRLDLQLMTYVDKRPIIIHQEQKDAPAWYSRLCRTGLFNWGSMNLLGYHHVKAKTLSLLE